MEGIRVLLISVLLMCGWWHRADCDSGAQKVDAEPKYSSQPRGDLHSAQSQPIINSVQSQQEPQRYQQDEPLNREFQGEPHSSQQQEEPYINQPQQHEPRSSQLQDEPQSSQPQEEPHSSQPQEEAEEPQSNQPQDEPHNSQPQEEPHSRQLQEEPHSSQPQEEPHSKQPQDEPHSSQPQEEPHSSQPQEEPHSSQPQEEPHSKQPQDEPHTSQPQEEPHSKQPQEEPHSKQPQDEPHTSQPQEEPHISQPQEEPHSKQPQEEPHSKQPHDEPHISQPQEELHSKQPQEEPHSKQPHDEPHISQPQEEPHSNQPQEEPHISQPEEELHISQPQDESHSNQPQDEPHSNQPQEEPHISQPQEEPHSNLPHEEDNRFTEEMLIRPLPSGHIYSHFEFTTTWSSPEMSQTIAEYKDFEFFHYDLFPRALGEIIERYHVRELHLSLTQGLWRHRKWGYPIMDSPPGAQLWVWFNPTTDSLDQTWRDLVNALSGLICASLNFIDSTNTVSPELSFRPQGLAEDWYAGNSSYLRYAALPRENVCTENLTPWMKLLPCDTRSGLSVLLNPVALYTAHYHSLSLHIRPTCQDPACSSAQLELVQALSLIQLPTMSQGGHLDWTFDSLFYTPLLFSCPLAALSRVYVDITGNENMEKYSLYPDPDSIEESGQGLSQRTLAVYDVHQALNGDTFSIEGTYSKPHIYGLVPAPPLHVSRFITGYGQESGSITVKFSNSGSKALTAVYLEVLPWYLRLFLHTSHSTHQMNSLYVSKLVTARDRERGWLYEAVVEIPAYSSIELSLEFSRALLKWLEYPPDANHGFYVPAATISALLPSPRNVSTNTLTGSTLKEKLLVKEGASFVRIHTETLLVSLPTPDFSMPYNVICLACTVVALAFGPIHNITTKKLVLKKVEVKESIVTRLMNKVRGLMGWGRRKETAAPQEPAVVVEQNPLYQDHDDLDNITEEEEEEEEEGTVCNHTMQTETKKDR